MMVKAKSLYFFIILFSITINQAQASFKDKAPESIQQTSDKIIQFKKHVAKGDSLFESKIYNEAMTEFQKASLLMPFEEYPHLKMQAIETITGMERFYSKPDDEPEEVDNTLEQGKASQAAEAEIKDDIPQKPNDLISSRSKTDIRNAILAHYKDTLSKLDDVKDRLLKSIIYYEIADTFTAINENQMALEYYQKALMVVIEEGNQKKAGDVYADMGNAYFKTGQIANSIDRYEKSVEIKSSLGDKKGASEVIKTIGNVYEKTFSMEKAMDKYKQSAEIKRNINDKEGLSEVMSNMGNLYYRQQILDKSIESYEESAELMKETNNVEKLGDTYNKIGIAYAEKGEFTKAEDFYLQSLNLNNKQGKKREASMTLNNIGNLNFSQNKYSKAIDYYEQSLNIKQENNYQQGKAISLYNLATSYKQMNQPERAAELFEASMLLAKENNLPEIQAKNIKSLENVYLSLNQPDKAASYTSMIKNSAYRNIDINEPLSESSEVGVASGTSQMIEYLTEEMLRQKKLFESEADKRSKENKISSLKLQNQAERINRQRTFLVSSGIVILLIAFVLLLLKRQIENKKKANAELSDKNDVITKQKKLITDNITSASYIQKAALPPDDMVINSLGEHFILNLPKDIVSGDFYWMEKKNDTVFIAVADCTGHGVQGAVVSMLGISLLNEIVNKNHELPTGEILDQLSEKVKTSLHQGSEVADIREGMDIVFCKLNKKTYSLEYSAANNPIYIVRENELIELKGNRSPIGYYSKKINFNTETFSLKPGDSIYMFSDGYADQLGGEEHKKYLGKRFKNLLVEIQFKSPTERLNLLQTEHDSWKGRYSQVDDILVMGIQV